MNERATKLTILLGFNGTGKTTLLKQILLQSNQRALVVTPDDVEWTDFRENPLQMRSDYAFDGIQRHIFNPDYSPLPNSAKEYLCSTIAGVIFRTVPTPRCVSCSSVAGNVK